jgi:cell division septum initiation protein DivIVA
MSTTDKSILERLAARMKEIIGIAEEAANRAMEAEKPPPPAKKRVSDLMESSRARCREKTALRDDRAPSPG